ncbi:MAG: hypothetical protein FJZ63_03765 [Chlamydiae bacterium]|nr:hypothetical protein [Chlamydiota bacterium]
MLDKLVSLLCVGFVGAVLAGEEAEVQKQPLKDPGVESLRFELRHIENKGVGYNTGYSTVEIFIAPAADPWDFMTLIDLRAHILNNGKFDSNVGFGFRMPGGCRLYGINFYWDYRLTQRYHYDQFGVGFETMGVRWDFRANGYIPFGEKESPIYDGSTVEFAMSGVDAEVAYHFLKNRHIDLYAAVGPYYYFHNKKGMDFADAIGGRARVAAKIYDYISLELINTYDSLFHENVQGSISLNVPLGPRARLSEKSKSKLKKCQNTYCLGQRLIQNVERQEIIVLSHGQMK